MIPTTSATKPRILFICRSTSGHANSGGMEANYEFLAKSFSAAGWAVDLLTTPGSDVRGAPAFYGSIIEVGRRLGRYSRHWWSGSEELAQRSHGRWDVVFSVSIGGASFSAAGGPGILLQCHGTAVAELKSSLCSLSIRESLKVPLNIARTLRERRVYLKHNGPIVAVGPGVADQLCAWPYNLGRERVTVLPNQVHEADFAFDPDLRKTLRTQLAISDSTRVAVFVGRLHRQKGVDIAVRSLQSNPQDHLIICGEGPHLAGLQRLTRRLRLTDRVHFLGSVSESGVRSALSAADLFIFPTRRFEGFPLNVLESVACGLPVLTTHRAGVAGMQEVRSFKRPRSIESVVWKDFLDSFPYPRERGYRDAKSSMIADYVDLAASLVR